MAVKQHALHIPESKEAPDPEHIEKQSHIAFGVALMLLGILFILKQIGLIQVSWPLILLIIGGAILVEAVLFRTMARVFPGIFLTLLGIIFLADSNGWISGGVTRNWPLVVLALSVSMIVAPLVKRLGHRNWNPGLSLLAVGSFLLVIEYDWIGWDLLNNILHWWPVVLLLVGAWYLFKHSEPLKRLRGSNRD